MKVVGILIGTALFHAIVISWIVVGFTVSDLCAAAPIEPMGHGKDAAAVVADDITGVWLIEGATSKGKYSGAATIERKGDVYLVRYTTGSVGVGVRVGDTFAVSWSDPNGHGVTMYRVGAKSLAGRWASLPGNGAMHHERLSFLRALPADEDEN